MVKIAPSILSADFANLERDIRRVSSADYLHVDVMDGCFVPNITIGIPVVQCIRPVTALPLDVHLMIDRPVRYVERFCQAGADLVTVHVESDSARSCESGWTGGASPASWRWTAGSTWPPAGRRRRTGPRFWWPAAPYTGRRTSRSGSRPCGTAPRDCPSSNFSSRKVYL